MQKRIHRPKTALSGINESDPGQEVSDSQHSTCPWVEPLSHITKRRIKYFSQAYGNKALMINRLAHTSQNFNIESIIQERSNLSSLQKYTSDKLFQE